MVAWFVSATRTIIIPFIIAILLAAILSPIADRLERRGVKRWIGALLCTMLVVVVGVGLLILIVVQVVNQAPQIGDQLSKAAADLADWLGRQGWGKRHRERDRGQRHRRTGRRCSRASAPISKGVGLLATLALVVVLSVNILFFLIKDGQEIQRWLSGHLGVPRDIGEGTLVYSAHSIRGYFVGTTLVGIVNALIGGHRRRPSARRWRKSSPSSCCSPTTSRSSGRSSAAPSPCSSPSPAAVGQRRARHAHPRADWGGLLASGWCSCSPSARA